MHLLLCFNIRYINSVDGNWGGIVDSKTNAFNGMIGMIQRQVFDVKQEQQPEQEDQL